MWCYWTAAATVNFICSKLVDRGVSNSRFFFFTLILQHLKSKTRLVKHSFNRQLQTYLGLSTCWTVCGCALLLCALLDKLTRDTFAKPRRKSSTLKNKQTNKNLLDRCGETVQKVIFTCYQNALHRLWSADSAKWSYVPASDGVMACSNTNQLCKGETRVRFGRFQSKISSCCSCKSFQHIIPGGSNWEAWPVDSWTCSQRFTVFSAIVCLKKQTNVCDVLVIMSYK